MPTKLSLSEMQVVAERHTVCEFTHDIKALMETVHPEPCWIYEPIGCEITTFAAVAEMYQRIFPTIDAIQQMPVVNMWFADDGFIGEVRLGRSMPDGSQFEVSQFTWCEFTGDLISGECNYIDAGAVDHLTQTLGASFFTYPGVVVRGRRMLGN